MAEIPTASVSEVDRPYPDATIDASPAADSRVPSTPVVIEEGSSDEPGPASAGEDGGDGDAGDDEGPADLMQGTTSGDKPWSNYMAYTNEKVGPATDHVTPHSCRLGRGSIS